VLRKDRDVGRHEVGVRGCLLAVVIIHEWIAVGTCSYNYGSTYAKHLHHEDDIMFLSQVIFRGIILGPHVDQLVIGSSPLTSCPQSSSICVRNTSAKCILVTGSLQEH